MYFYSYYNRNFWLPFGGPVPIIVSTFKTRVEDNGGQFEAEGCLISQLNSLGISLLNKASLLVTPNAYKSGTLYSVIPTNGNGDFTFTRATTATRFNSTGLVELVPYNIFEYTEDFSNAYWNRLGSTISTNTIAAPNGTITADKATETSANADHYVTKATNFTQGLTYTISVYAKAGERNWVALGFNNESQKLAWFNLTTGVVGTVQSSVTSTSIENVGNGWYRCSITLTAATNLPYPSVMIAPSNGVRTYLGDGTSGLYIWGAQFVEGTSAKPYQSTVTRLNIPRLDYSLGGCPSLLLEPQRTNLITWSQDYSSTWGSNFTSITQNLISPAGITNASTIVNNVGSNRSIFKAISVISGNTYTWTIYIRKISGTYSFAQGFRLSSWGPAVASQTYTDLGTTLTNDWVRYTHTFTATSTNTVYVQLISNEIHTFGLWGAQLEAGAYATSYIPTTSASVTRNPDILTRNNIYTNGLISTSGGTWFLELINNVSLTRSAGADIVQSLGISNGTSAGIVIRTAGTSRAQIYKYVASSPVLMRTTATDIVKIAVKWNGTSADIFENGVKVVSASSFTTTNMEFLQGSAVDFPKYIKSMLLAPTPLTDAECIQLTTI